MQCDACGEVNEGSHRFCHGCGGSLALTCLVCGSVSRPTASYCGACGSALGAPLAAVARPGALAPLPNLAPGELKLVTVLFVDLVSSTEMVAMLDAEAAMQRLGPALQTMCDVVERFGGTVVRTLGDGIMALFGAPRAQEGHAVLACQAALVIREALKSGPAALSVRGGLHCGEVVANAPLRNMEQNFDAYGMTLHIGSRLPAQVEPDEICLSETCYREVHSFCDARPLGLRTLRGVPGQMSLYSLVRLKPTSASRPFARDRFDILPPMLGRQNELTMLKTFLQSASMAMGSAVAVIGAPGTGKSRLCHEFIEYCRERLVPTFEARAQPYGAAIPLRPIVDLLRVAYFGLVPGDVSPQVSLVIGQRLAEAGLLAPADIALVCDFVGVPSNHGPMPWLSPKARTARLIEIVCSLARHYGQTTTVLLIEDLHWLDEGSEEFVVALADAVIGTKTMLLTNCRPTYDARWMHEPHSHEIRLTELNLTDTDLLVLQLLGPSPDLADLRQRITLRSGGNPFFAQELVRSLADEGVLIGQSGAYQLGSTGAAVALPATVQAVIGARVDRLPHADRTLLHIAAIIGKEFDVAVLERVVGQETRAMEATLERLCEAGLLQGVQTPSGLGYRFRHPLIQEVSYGTQLKARRSPLHAAVARAMERVHADRVNEFAGLISYHLTEAGESVDAAFYAARAARWIGLTSSTAAMRHWHSVRSLMKGEARSPANDTLRIEASGQIAWLGWREGLTGEQAQPFVQEALAWAREIDDSMVSLLMLVDGRMAQVNGGDSDLFVDQLLHALSLAEKSGDAGRVATLQASLSHAYGWAGKLREALAANDAALANLAHVTDADQQFLGYSVEHWCITLRGRLLLRLGRFDEARACFDRIIGTKGLIDPTVLFVGHYGYVDLAWYLGDVGTAVDHAAHVARLADRHGSAYLRFYKLASAAISSGIAGDFTAAIEGIRHSLEFQKQTKAAIEYEPELLASLAEYLMAKGELGEAATAAEQAVRLSRQRKSRLPECRAKITLARLALQKDGPAGHDDASNALAEAEQLIAETGADIYRPRLDEAHRLMSERFS